MFTKYEMGGTVTEQGKLVLDSPEHFAGTLRSFKRGRVRLRLEEEKNNRSQRANRYYFGAVLKAISDHTGHEVEELHEYFKLQYNPKEILIGGDAIVVGGSTRTLTTQKFYDYIEKIRRFASIELGITLPDPDRREVA